MYDEHSPRVSAEMMQQPAAPLDSGIHVSGPHDPQPFPADQSMREGLLQEREAALLRRDAHARELEEQTAHHRDEIDRAERVVAACTAAITELDGPADKALSDLQRSGMQQARQTS